MHITGQFVALIAIYWEEVNTGLFEFCFTYFAVILEKRFTAIFSMNVNENNLCNTIAVKSKYFLVDQWIPPLLIFELQGCNLRG